MFKQLNARFWYQMRYKTLLYHSSTLPPTRMLNLTYIACLARKSVSYRGDLELNPNSNSHFHQKHRFEHDPGCDLESVLDVENDLDP